MMLWLSWKKLVLLAVLLGFAYLGYQQWATAQLSHAELGRLLYFDVNLSKNRSQSCASCHNPATAFVDSRDNGVKGAVSLGDDVKSLGDRHAPTAAYSGFIPKFSLNADGQYQGGLFWDGREADLEGQAGGPPLNPIEMGMPSKALVIERILENPFYVESFKALYGSDIFVDAEQAYEALKSSIAAFERSDFFAPFDSKYDRYLSGDYELTDEEELGRTLFFSQQFTNCNLCHQLRTSQLHSEETFSNYQYHNIGIPINSVVRAKNGSAKGYKDQGLLANPLVTDEKQRGKFKVPTLRNVAVTAPYMHNGVFQDLRTVVLFYNRFNSKSAKRQINPETGKRFASPENPATLAVEELTSGPALTDKRIDALVAFLKTLTDKRYEHLLEEPKP